MFGRREKPEQKTNDGPSLAIGKRFKGYGQESERNQKKADIRADKVLQQLKDAFRKTECWYPSEHLEVFDEPYESALENLKGISYTAEDVHKFTIVLSELQGEEGYSSKKAGLFLSALVNNGAERDFMLVLGHIAVPPHCLAYKNTKNILIEGDVGRTFGMGFQSGLATIKGSAGEHMGMGMQGGAITVEGNVDFGLGCRLKGGSITVERNAGHCIGDMMKDGTIRIKGNAGHNIGGMMKGGEIHLEGEHGDLGDYIRGGRIFHKEQLISGE
jgi:hypothetical protein